MPKPSIGARTRWRLFLTEAELAVLAAADQAKAEWRRLDRERSAIVRDAILRANARRRVPPQKQKGTGQWPN